MTGEFWKPFTFRYASLQRLPKIIVLYFDFIFYKKWVTSIYNAETFIYNVIFLLDSEQDILYNNKLTVYIQILFTKGRYIMAQEILLTSAGLKELEAELEDLKVRGRQEIKEKIQVALSFGDLSENSEYEEARNDQGKLEARISEIEGILSMAKIIDEDALSTDIIQMGSKVTIKDIEYGDVYKYQIISSTSTSKDKGVDYLTSDESPVAKALIGHAVGDIVEVEAPIGVIKYEVMEISK